MTEIDANYSESEYTGLDQFDHAILSALAADGRMSITALAAKVGLSKSPTQVRVKRLEEAGVIQGYRALIDPVRLGRDQISFIEVRLNDTREAALRAFNKAITKIEQIEEAHLIAGSFDYLLKIRTHSMREYREVLADHISTLPHLASTSTYVAMQAVKEDWAPATL